MALRGEIHPSAGGVPRRAFFALNDVVVARGSLARVVRFEVDIGPSRLATYVADGLVVASPTGSTGYSFSAGGPILDPLSRNLIVTPIAAYLSAIRSVVVSPAQVVRCRIVEAHEALVSIDGREDIVLAVGDEVTVAALDRPIRFLEPSKARTCRSGVCFGRRPSRRRPERWPRPAPRTFPPAGSWSPPVTDLALLERLRVAFADGFNVLTGRRARGKSLLIDALGLALGARADPGPSARSRRGAGRALFDRLPEPLVCVREVASTGVRWPGSTTRPSRPAGSPASPDRWWRSTASTTRVASSTSAGSATFWTGFGGHEAERAAVAAAVGAWRENEEALAGLALDPRELERRIALVEHEAAEIAAARLRPGEAGEIQARLGASRHAEAIARGAATLLAHLSGDEGAAEPRPGPGSRRRSQRPRRPGWPAWIHASTRSRAGSPASPRSWRTSQRRRGPSPRSSSTTPRRSWPWRSASPSSTPWSASTARTSPG